VKNPGGFYQATVDRSPGIKVTEQGNRIGRKSAERIGKAAMELKFADI